MVRLLSREALLVLLSGAFAAYPVALILGLEPSAALFWAGTLMTLSFTAMYAMSLLAVSRAGLPTRSWIGLVAWLLAFGPDFYARSLPAYLLPLAFSLTIPAVAALGAKGPNRTSAAGGALTAFALPMAGVRWLLVPLVGAYPVFARIVLLTAGFYLLLRGIVRLLWPWAAEGVQGGNLLVRRPIPDHIVGLVEGSTGKNARPFATLADGRLDEDAVSILCDPAEAPATVQTLSERLAGFAFVPALGTTVGSHIEVVVRRRTPLPERT